MLRLSEEEHKTIVDVCKERDQKVEVYLYGSRTDLLAKGGDIDLLIVSNKLRFRDKLDILSALKERLGDQKIDLVIAEEHELATDPFLREIMKTAMGL